MGATKQLRFALIGAGAVGLFYAGHFARIGASVTIITRTPNDYSSSVFIDSCDGDFEFTPDSVIHLGDSVESPFDVVILATKVLPSIDMVELVRPYMGPDTILLMIQNGLFIETSLIQAYDQPILRGLAFLCSNRMNKTHIQHLDYGLLTIGQVSGTETVMMDRLYQFFNDCKVTIQQADDIERAVWEKLIWNAPFNPLSVFSHSTTADLLVDEQIVARIRAIMAEIIVLAKIADVHFDEAIIDKKINATRKMAPYKTSMCLDYEAGRPLEIECILGHPIRFAHQHSIDVPELKLLYEQLN